MLLLDPRAGSCNYEAPLRALGAPVEMCQLEFGDAAFFGSGHAVGVELKKIHDLLSCLITGRLAGFQLPGMARIYDEIWLIVEGMWRPNPQDGVLEIWRGGWRPFLIGKRSFMYRDLDAFLTTLEVKGGLRIKRSTSEDETARILYGLYQWWGDYNGHRSHLALNRAGRDVAVFARPTFARRVAAELPGVGFERSGDVAAAFPTVRRMLEATPKEWAGVKGIGKTLAKKITEAFDSAA